MTIIKKMIFIFGLIILLGSSFGAAIWGAVTVPNENLPVRNLEFINVDLRQVFRSLGATGRFNVILDRTVKGNVSIAFKSGITAQEAVAIIAKNYGYQYQWLSNSKTDLKAIFIGNLKSLTGNSDDKTLADIPLKYVDTLAAAASLAVVIPKERIKTDSNGHKLIVFGNPLELENVNEIIAKIDRTLSSVNVQVRIAEAADDFWKKLSMDRKVIQAHIGIYPVTASQELFLSDQTALQSLARRSLTLLDNQEGKLLFGDKIPIPMDKSTGSPAVTEMNAGTTLKITSWVGEGNQITLQIKETTLTAVSTLTAAPNKDTEFIPGFVSREVTSIIRMEAGQTFILTGIIGRDEFNRLKKITGTREARNYPVLNELFAAENMGPASQKAGAQVIALITPKFFEDISKQALLQDNRKPADAVSNTNTDPDQNLDGASMDTKTGDGAPGNPADNDMNTEIINQPKTEIVSNTASDSSKPDSGNDTLKTNNIGSDDLVTLVEYLVKKNDTITGICAKFNIEKRALIAANQWDNQNTVIKLNSRILIPVPKDRLYEIKPKETLWRIAKRYGITVELLKDLNNLTDTSLIKAGQEIVLPVAVSRVNDTRF
jgi:type II secretory pathway component GspD/PulD (secretin)/LysM repeat protein